MKSIQKIYLKSGSQFSEKLKDWAELTSNELVFFQEKFTEIAVKVDALLIFNENQSNSKEIEELKAQMDKLQKPIHKIDINGTLVAGITNLSLWMERTKIQNLLIVGGEELLANINFERYVQALN